MTSEIRPLDAEEVRGMIAMAAAEGWNPGLADAEAFRAADPEGFLGLFDGGPAPAAVISLVHYGEAFAFLGLYIAAPDKRGQGLGFRLWQAALDRAGARPVALDGVVAQQDNYRRSGFEALWRNVRHAGPAPAAVTADPSGVSWLERPSVDAVRALDTAGFGVPRPAFLAGWLTTPGHDALAAVRADGSVAGYGVARPCLSGTKIGPLFADDPEIAAGLLQRLSVRAGRDPVIVDVPEPNRPAMDLVRSLGWTPVFETARMCRGPAPAVELDRVFGITTLELG